MLYWLTRPVAKDQFHELKLVGPRERLEEIAATQADDPAGASGELMELLRAYPDYQPARLFYAEWHYKQKQYRESLAGYRKAFRLKWHPAARHYLYASQCASRLARHEEAREILLQAERALPAGQLSAVMLFNLACYQVRAGQPDAAMRYLRRAAAAGYRKPESYRNDRDLDPLRGRADFQGLLREVVS